MITLVRVLFWLPSVVLIAIIFYLMHWNKERLYLAVLTLPVIYFMWKVFNYNYFEPDSVFVKESNGYASEKNIQVLYDDGKNAVIAPIGKNTIKEYDEIITSPIRFLKDGSKVS